MTELVQLGFESVNFLIASLQLVAHMTVVYRADSPINIGNLNCNEMLAMPTLFTAKDKYCIQLLIDLFRQQNVSKFLLGRICGTKSRKNSGSIISAHCEPILLISMKHFLFFGAYGLYKRTNEGSPEAFDEGSVKLHFIIGI